MVKHKDIYGGTIEIETPESLDITYRGTLLSRILSMPVKTPIPFDDAIRLVAEKHTEAFDHSRFGDAPGQYGWYSNNFIEWISSLGYHIELTGDEFFENSETSN